MTANETRGEVSLTLDGEEMVLRPTFEAIQAFEKATGKGVITLARAALDQSLPSDDVAAVACECIKAWGRETDNTGAKGANQRRIGEMIMSSEGGIAGAMGTVAILLSMAATGGYDAKGEVKAPATKKKTPAGV